MILGVIENHIRSIPFNGAPKDPFGIEVIVLKGSKILLLTERKRRTFRVPEEFVPFFSPLENPLFLGGYDRLVQLLGS
jgi:hypothetical protein